MTNKYLKGIPENSRAAKSSSPFLTKNQITPQKLEIITKLNDFAEKREQTLAQMAIAWLLRDSRVTSVLVGASSPEQLTDNVGALENLSFSNDELIEIERILI